MLSQISDVAFVLPVHVIGLSQYGHERVHIRVKERTQDSNIDI
jgi:hypothetical protein